ncbi:MAG: hypothetical protein RJA07_723 [Bacteroidota bacterium]|jgi:NodT family efflux transporter outer membrane factor (OMF) lipoprotein
MRNIKSYLIYTVILFGLVGNGCKIPQLTKAPEKKGIPSTFNGLKNDSTEIAKIKWRNIFTDKNLISLIDTALKNNQELAITLQEIEISRNEVMKRHGDLFPKVNGIGNAGVEKVGRYTSQGAGDASADITPGKLVPDWLPNYTVGLSLSWEVDVWKKLHNAKKAAFNRYLASVEGKNFVLTNLIAEVANSYYELLALDNQLNIIRQSIKIQQDGLRIVKAQKEAGVATELGVKKFEAEVMGSQSLEYDVLQKMQEAENNLNRLLGRFPQHIARDSSGLLSLQLSQVATGVPSQLLVNRPDIRQAEFELAASKLDVKVARAEFYPSLDISSQIGLQTFNPKYLFTLPESFLASIAGDLVAPLINRKAIAAEYKNSNARQIQAVYNYDKTLISAFAEVSSQLSNVSNQQKIYEFKKQQVETLTKSIEISNDLFKSARADYLEVLLTQRDALDAQLELVETRLNQFNAVTNVYKALGGGWQ